MSRLVFDPVIHLVATTAFDPEAVLEWSRDNGLYGLIDDDHMLDTTIGRLYDDLFEVTETHTDLAPEFAGRFCYRSWEKGRGHKDYIDNILKQRHGSVLEHSNFTFALAGVSRTLTHELVRHRMGVAISQESQRYVEASDVRFIVPPIICEAIRSNDENFLKYEAMCEGYLDQYGSIQQIAKSEGENAGFTGHMLVKRVNEAARSVLPGNAETRMVWTVNARALRHVIETRGGEGADLEIRRFATRLLVFAKANSPTIFSDMEVYTAEDGFEAVKVEHSKV